MEANIKDIFDSVIIRFSGELWIKKAWTRRFFERRLIRNMKNVLKYHEVPYKRILRRHGRLFLRTDFAVEAARRVSRIFGISSVSPSLETSSSLDDVVDKSVFLAERVLTEDSTFAVRCQRVGNHPYSSADVCKAVGQRILDEFGENLRLKVDLNKPDVRVGIEARNDEAFVYSYIIDGAGGMPLGTQRPFVGLLSGGIDSAVACWLVMKRGCPVVPIYFDNTPFSNETTTKRAIDVAEVLFDWAVGFPGKVLVVQHGENLREIIEKCSRRLTCLLCKRMMYRIGERLAGAVNAEGIVTGEAIGEQASQTLTNLRVLSNAAEEYPVHRPLLGFDKAETEALARKIKTYEISSRRTGVCTAVPIKPVTMAKLKVVMEAEEKLCVKEMVDRSVGSLKIVEV